MRFPAAILDDVVRHCQEEVPDEACGILAAERWAPDVVVEHHRMVNYADVPTGEYLMDEAEQLAVWADLDKRNRRVVAIYHSHVLAPPTLSGADIRGAQDSRILHLVIALGRTDFELRLWRVSRAGPGGRLLDVVGEPVDMA